MAGGANPTGFAGELNTVMLSAQTIGSALCIASPHLTNSSLLGSFFIYHRERNCYRPGKMWGNYFLQPLRLPLPKNTLN
eukprot:804946-Amphidinium_carterae.1